LTQNKANKTANDTDKHTSYTKLTKPA